MTLMVDSLSFSISALIIKIIDTLGGFVAVDVKCDIIFIVCHLLLTSLLVGQSMKLAFPREYDKPNKKKIKSAIGRFKTNLNKNANRSIVI